VDVTARGVVFDAASAFLDGVAASERLRVAEEGDTVSRELLQATERRYALMRSATSRRSISISHASRARALTPRFGLSEPI
jgi:hypothetical protein